MSRLMSFKDFLENTPQEFKNISELKKSGPELELEKLLQKHDWFFTYASDHRDWKKGKKEYEKIQELVKKIGKAGEELFRAAAKQAGVMEKKNTTPEKSLSEQIQKVITDHSEHSPSAGFPGMNDNQRNIALGYGDGKVLENPAHFSTGDPLENTIPWTPKKLKKHHKNVY